MPAKAKTSTKNVETKEKTTNKGKFGSPATLKGRGKSVFHHITYSPVDSKSVKIVLTKEEAIKLAARLMDLAISDQIVDHEGGAIFVTAHDGGCGSIMGRLAKRRRVSRKAKA